MAMAVEASREDRALTADARMYAVISLPVIRDRHTENAHKSTTGSSNAVVIASARAAMSELSQDDLRTEIRGAQSAGTRGIRDLGYDERTAEYHAGRRPKGGGTTFAPRPLAYDSQVYTYYLASTGQTVLPKTTPT